MTSLHTTHDVLARLYATHPAVVNIYGTLPSLHAIHAQTLRRIYKPYGLHATHALVADEHVTHGSCEKNSTWTSLHVNNIYSSFTVVKKWHIYVITHDSQPHLHAKHSRRQWETMAHWRHCNTKTTWHIGVFGRDSQSYLHATQPAVVKRYGTLTSLHATHNHIYTQYIRQW